MLEIKEWKYKNENIIKIVINILDSLIKKYECSN